MCGYYKAVCHEEFFKLSMEDMNRKIHECEVELLMCMNMLEKPSRFILDDMVQDAIKKLVRVTKLLIADTERDLVAYRIAMQNNAWEK